MATDHFDVAIVGAGVIGLALAYRLTQGKQLSARSVVLLEQESGFGQHTSSRNSEVIHAGLYYPSGSLKAALCVRGKELLYEHCERYDVPHRRLGKLVIAGSGEVAELERIERQGRDNGVSDLSILDRRGLQARESAVQGAAALYSPSSGIVDAHEYMISLLHLAQLQGVQFAPRTRVLEVEKKSDRFVVATGIGDTQKPEYYRFSCSVLLNCAGLQAARLARNIAGIEIGSIPEIHYCKGDYFSYRKSSPFHQLVYPVPEANTAGLGIHATLDLTGRLRFGPDTSYLDAIDYQVASGKAEVFANAIRRYFPAIDAADLSPDYAGIRPKLAGPGQPPADFLIQQVDQHGVPGLLQLFGIESPGLTASLAIAEQVNALVREYL